MTLLALLIGLFVERMATQLFHLRRLRWLDRAIDSGFRLGDKFAHWPPLIPVLTLVVVLVLPVTTIWLGLGDRWFGFPYLVLSIIVLLFSLGPKDIGEDVIEYCQAVKDDDAARIGETARSLAEKDIPEDPEARIQMVEEAVCVQANNRLFAVIFWFVLLGPVGAWAYRATDLIRRRAVFNALRTNNASPNQALVGAAEMLHSWVAWIPARLTAIGYALAGSFDEAISAWREQGNGERLPLHEQSEQLLARVGVAALSLQRLEGESLSARGIRGAEAANDLVVRLLTIWAVVIGAMTLYGFSLL